MSLGLKEWKAGKDTLWGVPLHLVLSAFLLFIPKNGLARVGDLEATCTSRYGEPIPYVGGILEGSSTKAYRQNGWTIVHAFVNGRAMRVDYHKPVVPGLPYNIQLDELEKILKAEGEGGKWSKVEKKFSLANAIFPSIECENTNGKRLALMGHDRFVRVETKVVDKYLDDLKQKKNSARKQSIPDF